MRATRPPPASSRAARGAACAEARPEAPNRPSRHARLVDAFLAAARGGDFEGLLAVLDPDVVLRADAAAVALGAAPEIARGGRGRRLVPPCARRARAALLDGAPVLVWMPGGAPRVVYRFTEAGERIVGVDLVSDPGRVGAATLVGEPWTG